MNPAFERYIGIDYSSAQTPKSSIKGLCVYEADRLTAAHEIQPPPSPRKYWTRRGVAEWLVEKLSEGLPTIVGIDHGFSFPLQYFEQHGLPLDWPSFLDDFQRHWPTDEDIYVDFVRGGSSGNGTAHFGNSRWWRLVVAALSKNDRERLMPGQDPTLLNRDRKLAMGWPEQLTGQHAMTHYALIDLRKVPIWS